MPTLSCRHPKPPGQRGFTIIEVLIVLAIAGLILLIVLLFVPTLQRNARNYDRKNYTALLSTAMQTYYNDNGHLPGGLSNPHSSASQTEICNFLKTLPRVLPSATCGYSTATSISVNGTFPADCATIEAGAYTICYQSWDSVEHGYIGPEDEVDVMIAHWCNVGANADPAQPSTDPVAGNDTDTKRFAVWTTLEQINQPLCFDGSPNYY